LFWEHAGEFWCINSCAFARKILTTYSTTSPLSSLAFTFNQHNNVLIPSRWKRGKRETTERKKRERESSASADRIQCWVYVCFAVVDLQIVNKSKKSLHQFQLLLIKS
jgi:hypothetical protein